MTPAELALLEDFATSYPRLARILRRAARHKMPPELVQYALRALSGYVAGCRSERIGDVVCEVAY